MPNILRVKCYYAFSDIKTFFYSTNRFIHELRRFSLLLQDKGVTSYNTIFDQLVKNIQKTFKTFSPKLVSDGQPFRLYWKDNDGEFIAFFSQRELMEAIFAMMPVGKPVATPGKRTETQSYFLEPCTLKIHVLVLDKMATENTHPSALFVDFSYPTSSAATSAATAETKTSSTASTQSSTSFSSTAPTTTPSTPASPSEIKAVQEIKAAPTETEPPSSDEISNDEYDVVTIQKEIAECLE